MYGLAETLGGSGPGAPPGQVFTPPVLARGLARLALEALRMGGHGGAPRVVEPAAGDGALVEALLAEAHAESLSPRVTAIELDPQLCAGMRARIARDDAWAGVQVLHADALSLVSEGAPPTQAGSDFGALAPAQVAKLRPELLGSEQFDLVIANPPWLRETGHAAMFRELRRWHHGAWRPWYRKDCDLHHFFWPLAMRWLRPGGVLAFLVPANFFDSRAAAPVREALGSGGRIVALWRAGAELHFPRAAVEASFVIWRRGESGSSRWLESIRSLESGGEVALAASGEPWWRPGADEDATDALGALEVLPRLGALFRISEGVSAGCNRLRKEDASLVRDGREGEGVLLLRGSEVDRLGLSPGGRARLLRRRLRVDDQEEWLLYVRDGEIPELDDTVRETHGVAGEGVSELADRRALARHLRRFEAVLRRRAEIARNPSRSWYALAWARPEMEADQALATPKWARRASFVVVPTGSVPMTDFRVLVPRDASVAARAPAIAAWLNGEAPRIWLRHRLRRKGAMLEFYGDGLAGIPVGA